MKKDKQKKKVDSVNPFYRGASPEDVAQALLKHRPKQETCPIFGEPAEIQQDGDRVGVYFFQSDKFYHISRTAGAILEKMDEKNKEDMLSCLKTWIREQWDAREERPMVTSDTIKKLQKGLDQP